MPIISSWAPSCQRPPESRVSCSRTEAHADSESIRTPSRSKMTAAIEIETCLGRALQRETELVVELERKGDRVPGRCFDLIAVERLEDERDVTGLERMLTTVDVDSNVLVGLDRLRDLAGVQGLDRGGDLRHLLAEARAERS